MRNSTLSSKSRTRLAFAALAGTLIAACSPPVPQLTGHARTYSDAKDLFKRGRFEKTLDFTEELAEASPPNAFTERARVLRAVIFAGEMQGYQDQADAYGKGEHAVKNPEFQSEYRRQRSDNMEHWSRRALSLAQVTRTLTKGGNLPKEVTLDAPYPDVQGPAVIPVLDRVESGGQVSQDDEGSAALDAERKGIVDVLGEVSGTDPVSVRSKLMAGPLKLDGTEFILFLVRKGLEGARVFDSHHLEDPEKFRAVCGIFNDALQAVHDTLKNNPNDAQEKEVKDLEAKLKTMTKKQPL